MNNSNRAVHAEWDRTTVGSHVLTGESKQREEARLILVITDQSWRHWYEIILNLIQMQIIAYRNIYTYVDIHGIVYILLNSLNEVIRLSLL